MAIDTDIRPRPIDHRYTEAGYAEMRQRLILGGKYTIAIAAGLVIGLIVGFVVALSNGLMMLC